MMKSVTIQLCVVSYQSFHLTNFQVIPRLKYITAWILRFISNYRAKGFNSTPHKLMILSTKEINSVEVYWVNFAQNAHFIRELEQLQSNQALMKTSSLLSLHPFLDSNGSLRVGGRQCKGSFSSQHLPGTHLITKLIVHSEHLRLLHEGISLLTCSLSQRYYIIGCRKVVRSITQSCFTCRHPSAKPQSQVFSQLPIEQITPDSVFSKVSIDYAGPVYIKHEHV